MDTYGIINLTELDRMSENIKREISSPITTRGFTTMSSELSLLQEIKELCLKLPAPQDIFERGMFIERRGCGYGEERLADANSFISEFIKSDNP